MRLRSEVMLVMLASALPDVFAADASGAAPARALVQDSRGQPVLSSSGECWHSSLTASPGRAFAPGCRSASSPPAAVAQPEGPAALARTDSAGGPDRSDAIAAGASQQTSQASGAAGSAPYLTDSRGIIVRGSRGECWRTGSWTPAQATVVGCDGVLARAQPVPAPSEPGKADAAPRSPSAQPSTAPIAPSSVTPSEAPPLIAPNPPNGRESAAPIAPAVPVPAPAGPASAAPGGTTEARSEPRSEKVSFDTDTFFDFDESELKPAGKAKLDTLASRIAEATVEVVVAVGHADAIGSKAYNQRLSERRAKAVMDYLKEKGLPQKKIFIEGKGETQPVASNASTAGRAKNRRVEVEVVAIRSKK